MLDIYLRNQPPPVEKFDHTSFISFLASWITPHHYLELGTRSGDNFIKISKLSIESTAVDMDELKFSLPDNSNFFNGLTDEFFDTLNPNVKFDLIFIDADHSHKQSLKDFLNAQKFLIEDGFIILHDTYPIDESYLDPTICDDSYRTAHFIKQNLSDSFESLTLPFHPGLTIVKKMNKSKQLLWKDE
jgi:hypothetical protein